MKNAFIAVLLAATLTAFFSFANRSNRAITQSDDDEYTQDDGFVVDTVPAKKNGGKGKSKTVPYDSFGKPKKMDSTQLK